MVTYRTYSFDEELIKAFEQATPSGNRSRIIAELMRDHLDRFFPKKDREKLLSLEKELVSVRLREIQELEREAQVQARQAELVIEARLEKERQEGLREKVFSDSKFKAKQLTNIEFGLDKLSIFLPDDWSTDQREKYLNRWKELTQVMMNNPKPGEKEGTGANNE